jgi:NAD(P)-dependent dehydrogenase (short-subunit alcohol dehydrogenase family)
MGEPMSEFQDKVVLVTGGNSGIGRATAEAFARKGAKVVLTGRREDLGREVAANIKKTGGEATYFRADVTREEDARRTVETVVTTYGRLDIAFNNAGTTGRLNINVPEQEVENFQRVINTNVLGVLLGLKYQIPAMLKTGGGVIVNTASVAGLIALPGVSIYCASKHAVLGLTKVAALEYAKQGIRICSVSPGGVDTPMWDEFVGPASPENTARVNVETVLHPLGRIGRPEEIATAVLWLCSPTATFAVGTNLVVDGGWILP